MLFRTFCSMLALGATCPALAEPVFNRISNI